MVVSKVVYGTVETHTGTLAEVAGSINGYPTSAILSVFYNGTNITAVTKVNQV